jgi:molybdenum cofactor cytidylyltransferase
MVSCIVLAAGASSRFGSPKPLARIHSRPLISLLSEQLLKTQLGEIFIVLGADAEAVRPCVCSDPKIRCVFNESFSRGQTSSFKKGLKAVSADSDGVLLLPADVPFVKPETINMIIETFSKNPFPILVPTYKGQGGHPPAFSKTLFAEFTKLSDEAPLSTIQQIHASEILRLPVSDEGILLSFNTPQEFEKIRKKIPLAG